MDHVPHTGPRRIRVPYLDSKDWDGRDFLTYPRRCGFDYNYNARGQTQSQNWDPPRIIQLLQTWLFFGLFTETMRLAEIEFECAEFIEVDDVGSRLMTKRLPHYLSELARYEEAQVTGKVQRFGTIRACLETAADCLVIFSSLANDKNSWENADKVFVRKTAGPVLLSIYRAGTSLARACEEIYREAGGSLLKGLNWTPGGYLNNLMIEEGWCPSLTGRLGAIGDSELEYVGYTCGPPDIEPQDHSGCNSRLCNLMQVSESGYRTVHEREDCSCESLLVPREKLEAIIAAGQVPICRLLIDKNEAGAPSMSIEVESVAPDRPYIAISHVWAHGLGNPIQNGLPQCALMAIQCKVSGAFAGLEQQQPKQPTFSKSWSKWFWMDTLCVPIHPDAKALRKQSILLMKDIYGGAFGVLVLDRDVQKREIRDSSVGVFVSILLSAWYSRLWTMQEAVLARKIVVLIKIGAIDLDVWIQKFISQGHREATALGSHLARTCVAIWRGLRRESSLIMMDNPKATTLRALSHRTTSRSLDETICISTLLGLDVSKVLSIVPDPPRKSVDETCDLRTAALFSMMHEIPATLIFSVGNRLNQPGFGWAPRSFLRQNGNDVIIKDFPTAVVTSNGLEISLDSMILTSDVATCKQFLLVEVGGSGVPFGVMSLPTFNEELPRNNITPPISGYGRRNLALLFAEEVGPLSGGPAILVSIEDRRRPMEGIKVRYLDLMGAKRLPNQPKILWRMMHQVGVLTFGKVLPGQKWIIS